MKKFTNKFYELYLAESSFTKKCRLLKKILDHCQYSWSDNKNRNSVFIYSTFMVNTKNL